VVIHIHVYLHARFQFILPKTKHLRPSTLWKSIVIL